MIQPTVQPLLPDAAKIRLAYASRIADGYGQADIDAIVEASRASNTRVGITGVLAYDGGQIMQILEGGEREVLALYERIRVDARHQGVVELSREPIEAHFFEQWGMTQRPISDVLLMADAI